MDIGTQQERSNEKNRSITMRLPTKKLFCENTSPFIKALILKKRAGIPLTECEVKQFEKEILKETVSMVEPTKYHNRLSTLPQPISEPPEGDLDDTDAMSKEEVENLVKRMVLDMLDEEEHDDEDWNDILENLTKN